MLVVHDPWSGYDVSIARTIEYIALRFLLVHRFWSHRQISLGAKVNHVWPIYYDFPVNGTVSRRVNCEFLSKFMFYSRGINRKKLNFDRKPVSRSKCRKELRALPVFYAILHFKNFVTRKIHSSPMNDYCSIILCSISIIFRLSLRVLIFALKLWNMYFD